MTSRIKPNLPFPALIPHPASDDADGDFRTGYFLETKHARVGAVLQCSPQPHLMLYPPVRVFPEAMDAFLDACLTHARTGRSEWLLLSADPRDGEVSLRIDLTSGSPEEALAALDRATSFLDAEFENLVRACLARG